MTSVLADASDLQTAGKARSQLQKRSSGTRWANAADWILCLAPPDPPLPDSGSAAEATASGRGRCDARQIATSQDFHPVTRSLPETRAQEPLSRAGERPNAAPRVDPSAIDWSTQRIVSSPAMCPARAPTSAPNRPLLPSEPIPASARAVPHRHVSRPWLVASELPHEVGQLLAELGFAGSVDAEPTTLRADPGLAMTVRPSSYRHRGVVTLFPARSGIRSWWR